jgi:hypothetical protein
LLLLILLQVSKPSFCWTRCLLFFNINEFSLLFCHTLFNLWYMGVIITTSIIICEISIYAYIFIPLKKKVYLYHSNIPKNITHMSSGSWYLFLSPKDQLSSFIVPFEILPTHYHIPFKPTYTTTFPIGQSSYFSSCDGTCQNWHFPFPINIAKYSNFITLCCVFSSLAFWECYGTIIFSFIGFFDKSFTWIKVCHTFNKCSLADHMNTSPILYKSSHKHLVINPSYNIMYLPWFATSYNYTSLPYWWFRYSFDSIPMWEWTHCNSQYYLG